MIKWIFQTSPKLPIFLLHSCLQGRMGISQTSAPLWRCHESNWAPTLCILGLKIRPQVDFGFYYLNTRQCCTVVYWEECASAKLLRLFDDVTSQSELPTLCILGLKIHTQVDFGFYLLNRRQCCPPKRLKTSHLRVVFTDLVAGVLKSELQDISVRYSGRKDSGHGLENG